MSTYRNSGLERPAGNIYREYLHVDIYRYVRRMFLYWLLTGTINRYIQHICYLQVYLPFTMCAGQITSAMVHVGVGLTFREMNLLRHVYRLANRPVHRHLPKHVCG